MSSAVVLIAICALAAWLLVRVAARVKVTIAVVKERAYMIWIALAVIVAVSFAAYR